MMVANLKGRNHLQIPHLNRMPMVSKRADSSVNSTSNDWEEAVAGRHEIALLYKGTNGSWPYIQRNESFVPLYIGDRVVVPLYRGQSSGASIQALYTGDRLAKSPPYIRSRLVGLRTDLPWCDLEDHARLWFPHQKWFRFDSKPT